MEVRKNHSEDSNIYPFVPRKKEDPPTEIIWSKESEFGKAELKVGKKTDVCLFSDVMSVREEADPRWPDQGLPMDEYSEHFCMYLNALPVACVSITRALDGKMFLQEFFPPQILDAFYDCLMSAYRFRVLGDYRHHKNKGNMSIRLSHVMARESIIRNIFNGVRVGMSTIDKSFLPFYEHLGYRTWEGGTRFFYPILEKESCALFLPLLSLPLLPQELVEKVPHGVSYEDVRRVLKQRELQIASCA